MQPPRGRAQGPAAASRRPGLSRPALVALVVVLLVGVPASWLGRSAAATTPRMIVAAAGGDSRADPVPLGQDVTAGPLNLRVVDVAAGPSANERIAAASPLNEPPPDGLAYVLVDVSVRNDGDRPVPIAGGDFALTGSSGLIRRFVGVQPPDPVLDGTIDPGAAREGWIVLAAPTDETDLLLLFDSLDLPGVWADRVLALEAGATIADARAAATPNDVGVDVNRPAGRNQAIVTADWEVELLDVASGADVFNLVDYRTGALGVEDSQDDQPWLALRLRITNVHAGGEPAFLPPNAFSLVNENGDPVLDAATLTPPNPDASGEYYPGASREGWVAFELPSHDAYTVRFLPYATTTANPDPRYLSYG